MTITHFNFFVEGKGVTKEAQKNALLLHGAGLQVQDTYYNFHLAKVSIFTQ